MNPARAGFTLLEIVIVFAVTLILCAAVYGLAGTGGAALSSSSIQSDLDNSLRQGVESMISEVGQSGAGTFSPALPASLPGNSALSFQKNLGYSGGTITWGPVITYQFEYEPGETNNGLDDNNNGVVDEGILVRIEGSRRRVLCKWVKEGGVQFALSGRKLTIRIEGIRRDKNRRTHTAFQETTFHVPQ